LETSVLEEQDMAGTYTLPRLGYELKALAPHISEAQLTLHYQKHHQAYVTGANALFEKFDRARKDGSDLDMKATLKELSFHAGGHRLHTLFWGNLAPAGKGGGGEPKGAFAKAVMDDYGSFARFRKEFTAMATSVEGSGWAALTFSRTANRLIPVQIEKHNVNIPPGSPLLLVLDVWEHAYYLDYRNDRAKFVEAFWNIVNWDEVNRRYEAFARP
jgi:Fe-Mn family superoxide dismutase